MNPYWGADLFSFFAILFTRLLRFCTGEIPFSSLASDEVQFLVLMGIAISSALVGSFLVLKKMTMLANSLSHTILVGIVLAYLIFSAFSSEQLGLYGIDIRILITASLITALLTALLTLVLKEVVHLQEDASIGLVFSSLFALGITLVTIFTRNVHLEVEVVMGNVDALHLHDLRLVGAVLGIDLLLILPFFKEFVATTFDSNFSSSSGISPLFYNGLMMVALSATAIGAFRAVGVLLVLAFLVIPTLIARLLTHRIKLLIVLAAAIGSLCSLFAVALSRHLLSVYDLPLSTAGLVVVVMALFYLVTVFVTQWKKRRVAA